MQLLVEVLKSDIERHLQFVELLLFVTGQRLSQALANQRQTTLVAFAPTSRIPRDRLAQKTLGEFCGAHLPQHRFAFELLRQFIFKRYVE